MVVTEQFQAMASEERILALDVPCDREAPARVRAALARVNGVEPVLADVTLVASELVTDAVLHSGGSAAETLRVTAVLGQDGLLLSVYDPESPGSQPRAAETRQPRGWGLRIVEQLASRWGSEREGRYRVLGRPGLAARGRPAHGEFRHVG